MCTKFYFSLISRRFKGQDLESKQQRLKYKGNVSPITSRKWKSTIAPFVTETTLPEKQLPDMTKLHMLNSMET